MFVGNYTHAPNVDAALWLGREILPRVRRHRPAARLALAGMLPPPALRQLEGSGVRCSARSTTSTTWCGAPHSSARPFARAAGCA